MASTISSFEDGGESATGSKTTTTAARKKLESVNREPEQENSTWLSLTVVTNYRADSDDDSYTCGGGVSIKS
ncbi:hypothetical protein Droror1_Dr00009073 [Drosera rotundifolia]